MKKWQIVLVAVLLVAGIFFVDGGSAYIKQLINRPPKADFTYRTASRTLQYIAPTDEDTITFTSTSSDPDNDGLSCSWLVDDKLASSDRNYSTRLSAGNHTVKLLVSDGKSDNALSKIITVDEAGKHSQHDLCVPIKGIMYDIGRKLIGELGNPPSIEEIAESLEVIQGELKCNAIKIHGDYEDLIIKCAEMAIERGFKEVVLNPRYMRVRAGEDIDISDHLKLVTDLAKRAEELRVRTNYPVVLCVGDELVDYVRGITNASRYADRCAERDNELRKFGKDAPMLIRLNEWLVRIMNSVKAVYRGTVTYAPSQATRNYIDWTGLGVDIVFPHLYFATASYDEVHYQSAIMQMRRFQKPLWLSEIGCATYVGAGRWGGGYGENYRGEAYSQEEQAESIRRTVELLNASRPDAVFLWVFMQRRHSDDYMSAGILRWTRNAPAIRKLGFYQYKRWTPSVAAVKNIPTYVLKTRTLIEAEDVAVKASFARTPILSAEASGGAYVTPNAYMRFSICLEKDSDVVLWGRVRGLSYDNNSFWVSVDGGRPLLWELPVDKFWRWSRLVDRETPQDYMFHLSAGIHIIEIVAREDGSQIDALLASTEISFFP